MRFTPPITASAASIFWRRAAEDEESAVDGAVNGIQGWIACFPKAELSGVVRAVGVSEAGEIASREDLLEQAYDMGRNIA